MVLEEMVNSAWKTTKKLICGGLLLTQLYSPAFALEKPTDYLRHHSDKRNEQLVQVNYYIEKGFKQGKTNKYMIGINKEQLGVKVDQIEHAWIAVCADKGEIGEPTIYLQTRTGKGLVKCPLTSDLRRYSEDKLEKAIITILSQLPGAAGPAIDISTRLKNKELDKELANIKRTLKHKFGDNPYKLFHIPRGKLGGVSSGYKKILLEVPIKGNSTVNWWTALETSKYVPNNNLLKDVQSRLGY